MSAREVDEYLRGVEEPKRSTLEQLRRTILEIVPDAEQVISYRVPAFRVGGNTIAGFAAFKAHLSYLPFSGSVLEALPEELRGYTMTKSALHFPVDRPLPKSLVEKLIGVRLEQLRRSGGATKVPLIHRHELDGPTIRGEDHGASISLIIDESEPGQGPRLHRHAYDETWVVQEGNISFQVGDQQLKAGPGDVAIIPPGVPHKFVNDGPGRSRIVCIHASPTIVGEWLE